MELEQSEDGHTVKDSQSQQRTEALRCAQRIRAKQYLLLKLESYLLQEGLYIPNG
jgi:hypothetical protein